MKISKTPASLLLSFSAYLAFSSGLLALDNLSGTVTSADALSYEDVIVTGDLNLTGNGILFNGDISSSGPPPGVANRCRIRHGRIQQRRLHEFLNNPCLIRQ